MKEQFFSNVKKLQDAFSKVEVSDKGSSHYLYITVEHGDNLRQYLSIASTIKTCSFIVLGFHDTEVLDESRVPIDLSVNFAWYNSEENAYPITLPAGSNTLRAPRNIEIRGTYFWNSITNRFYRKKNSEIDICLEMQKIQRWHLLPTKRVVGSILRLFRYIEWHPIAAILRILKMLFLFLFRATSGKAIRLEEEDYIFNYLFSKKATPKYKVIEDSSNDTAFYGIRFNSLTLVFYASVNLILYGILFSLNMINPFILSILQNAFLIALYVVVSVFSMQFAIARIFEMLTTTVLKLIARIESNRIKRYK